MESDMEGEFREALGTLRHELKEELKYLVGHRLLSEEPDDIVRNDWDKLLQKFEELIQRKKNRILERLNEIQRKLEEIKLEDILESLREIRRKQRELKEELRRSEEALENILGKGELIKEAGEIEFKKMKLKLELERLEEDLYSRGSISEVEKIKKKQRELREELKRLEEDLKNIEGKEEYNSELAFRFIKGYNIDKIDGFIGGFIEYLIGEDKCRLVEPYLKKRKHLIEEINKTEVEENALERMREKYEFLILELKGLEKTLEKIKLIEAQINRNKIQEFIKDLIKEMRQESRERLKKISSYKRRKIPYPYTTGSTNGINGDVLS